MNPLRIPMLLLIVTLLAAPALGDGTVACHCFQQRAFDPSSPRGADPYLLAATSNALLAQVFRTPRRDLVKAKMGGTPDPALWVALFLADTSERTAADLLAERQKTGGWGSAFGTGGADPETVGSKLTTAILAGATEERLAELVLTEILRQRLELPTEHWAPLFSLESTRQEKVAALLLSATTGRAPGDILREGRGTEGSWGLLYQQAALVPRAFEAAWAKILAGDGEG